MFMNLTTKKVCEIMLCFFQNNLSEFGSIFDGISFFEATFWDKFLESNSSMMSSRPSRFVCSCSVSVLLINLLTIFVFFPSSSVFFRSNFVWRHFRSIFVFKTFSEKLFWEPLSDPFSEPLGAIFRNYPNASESLRVTPNGFEWLRKWLRKRLRGLQKKWFRKSLRTMVCCELDFPSLITSQEK